jgi:hypothetical protein
VKVWSTVKVWAEAVRENSIVGKRRVESRAKEEFRCGTLRDEL